MKLYNNTLFITHEDKMGNGGGSSMIKEWHNPFPPNVLTKQFTNPMHHNRFALSHGQYGGHISFWFNVYSMGVIVTSDHSEYDIIKNLLESDPDSLPTYCRKITLKYLISDEINFDLADMIDTMVEKSYKEGILKGQHKVQAEILKALGVDMALYG